MKSIAVVPESDELLVKKALEGDKSAFGQLVVRYQKRVFALVMEMVHHKQDAEDITQEVFVRVFFSLKNFRAESSFYTWLYRVAYNMTIDFKRRVARRPQDAVASTNKEGDTSNIEAISDVQLPDEIVDTQERQQSIRAALSEISEEHRAVILLREVDGLSYDEISKVTGSARGTVMSRLYYARKHLQQVLKGLRSNAESGDPKGGDPLKVSHGTLKSEEIATELKSTQAQGGLALKREKISELLSEKFNSINFGLRPKGAKI